MRHRHKIEDDYRELDLEPGATLEEVKIAYRELALFWHPDQFHDRPERLPKANQKMTRINLAYERLRKALAQQPKSPSSRAKPAPSTNSAPPGPQPPAQSRTSTLGLQFVSIPGISVLFATWETRIQDYAVFVQETPDTDSSWKMPGFPQDPTHPVVNVSWDDARNFCAWLTAFEIRQEKLPGTYRYRLPTDAEWSSAVGLGGREGQGSPLAKGERIVDEYPWGKQWPPPKGCGNYDPSLGTDPFDHTSPVGSFAPHAHGLYDLGGNVWEWCEDCLNGVSGVRVLRGASWNFHGPRHLLSSYRNGVAPDARSPGIGFRCVLEPG